VNRRWAITIAAAVVALLIAGSALWAAFAPGSYGHSRAGCVTTSVPSTTGGALVHACGDRARALCSSAFRHEDKLSRAVRPQCRAAGLGPGTAD
jgi:hypothetical protein